MATAGEITEHPFDEKVIMSRAMAVTMRIFDSEPPVELEQRLEAILKNREAYHKELRQNIISICNEILHDPKYSEISSQFSAEDREVLAADDQELSRSLGVTKVELNKGDIYAVKPEDDAGSTGDAANEDVNSNSRALVASEMSVLFDPRVERILRSHEEHARRVIGRYRDLLAREREKKHKMKTRDASGASGNETVVVQGSEDAPRRQSLNVAAGEGSMGKSGTLIDVSRDPRRRSAVQPPEPADEETAEEEPGAMEIDAIPDREEAIWW